MTSYDPSTPDNDPTRRTWVDPETQVFPPAGGPAAAAAAANAPAYDTTSSPTPDPVFGPAPDPAFDPAAAPAPGATADGTAAPAKRRRRLIPTKAGMGSFVRHRATQLVAALIIGLGLGAGGMALIGLHDGDRGGVERAANQNSRADHSRGGQGDQNSDQNGGGFDNRGGRR